MFHIVRCPNCTKHQITSAKKVFSCRFCGKTKTMSLLRIYYSTPDAPIATQVLQKIKEEFHSRHDEGEGDFFSYVR